MALVLGYTVTYWLAHPVEWARALGRLLWTGDAPAPGELANERGIPTAEYKRLRDAYLNEFIEH